MVLGGVKRKKKTIKKNKLLLKITICIGDAYEIRKYEFRKIMGSVSNNIY